MNKQQKIHHSISEFGSLQVRIITEFTQDDGEVIDKEYSDPFTPGRIPTDEEGNYIPKLDEEGEPIIPEDIGGFDMSGWDDVSKDVMTAITAEQTLTDFAAEKQTQTGTGLEEIVSYDRTITGDTKISVRRITRIFNDGKESSKKFHRSMIVPDSDSSTADVMSKAIAVKLHTQAVKDTYAANIVMNNEVQALGDMYPNARYDEFEGTTKLDKFNAWVTAGHTNAAYCNGEGVDQTACEANSGTWVAEALIAEAIDFRQRKMDKLNADLQTYLYTKYDVGTQISFQAIETRVDTPEAVKTALGTLFTWISGVMNYYYGIKIAIRDGVDWELVTYDFTTFDATDPDISLEALMGPS